MSEVDFNSKNLSTARFKFEASTLKVYVLSVKSPARSLEARHALSLLLYDNLPVIPKSHIEIATHHVLVSNDGTYNIVDFLFQINDMS